MDENNKPKPEFSFPNSDRSLDSKEEIKGPVAPSNDHETVKYKDVMQTKESQFINNETGIPQIETYTSDVAIAIKKNNVSAMQIAMSEQKKQQELQKTVKDIENTESRSFTVKIIFAGLVLVILILGYLWWAGYLGEKGYNPQNQIDPNLLSSQPSSPIKIEQRQIITVNNKDAEAIKEEIIKAKNGDLDSATIKEVVLSLQGSGTNIASITTSDLFTKLGTHAPEQLMRALGTSYIMGVYGSSPREFFILFTVKSYDNAFAGMLNWESYLSDDFGSIFERKFEVGTSTATSSLAVVPTSSGQVNQKIFTDKILFNKDTRVLNTAGGQAKILYSFTDPKTLVIVSSETGLRELIARLTTGKITR